MMWIVTVVVLLCWSKVLLFLMLPAMGFMMSMALPDQWYLHTLAQDSVQKSLQKRGIHS